MKINKTGMKEICLKAMKEHKIPGLCITVIQNGSIDESLFLGVKDDKSTPLSEDTLFEAASLTKPFFALYFMRLAERGIISPDEPLCLQNGLTWSLDQRFSSLTPVHCLSHTTGLPNWGKLPLDMAFAPGEKYSYSGEGYFLLQKTTDKLTGIPWETACGTEFFEPWGVKTSVEWNKEIEERISFGWGEDGKVNKIRNEVRHDGNAPEPNSAWSLYANSEIYARFVCDLMNNRGGLSQGSYDKMLTPVSHASLGVDWCLGWGVSFGLRWHWGDNTGFKNFVIWDPEDKNGVVIFTNSDRGMNAYFDILREITGLNCIDNIYNFITEAE